MFKPNIFYLMCSQSQHLSLGVSCTLVLGHQFYFAVELNRLKGLKILHCLLEIFTVSASKK